MNADKILAFAEFFESIAKRKGRSEKSVKKQYKTMTKGEEHPFSHMVEKFKKHKEIDDPEGLAAWIKDIGHPKGKAWRKGPKKN